MCPANEIQRGALPPLVSGANRSEVFCDSVGCQVPYRIGLRSFSLLRMGWGYTSRAWLGLSRASVQRRGRRWRCAERQAAEHLMVFAAESMEVVLDPDLFSPETLTQAAEPLQRYTYESLFGGSAASESSAFSVDHQVFGNYGSLWSFFALADPSRWTMADGMTPACPSTCTLAIRAVRLLGAWAEDHGSAWEVELSLFVAPRDLCVLVDGNRLFQTHPQSYLTPWSCFMQHERRSSRSSGQGVVSYSGTVALLRCRFPTAPQGAVELTVSSTIIPLQALGWLIGVDHFVIYDRDGSLEEDGVLEPYIKTGYVSYFPRFSFFALSEHHDAVHALPGLPSAAAPDAQAASHCLFMQRGLTEWVSFLHSPDEYLSNKHGLRHVEEVLGVLRPLRDQGLAAVDVTAIYFTRSMHRKPQGPVRPSPWLFGRYVYRASVPIQLRDWGSPVAGFLNRFGSPLVVPERVSDLVSAHYPRPAAGTFYLDDVPMDFLRANHYGHGQFESGAIASRARAGRANFRVMRFDGRLHVPRCQPSRRWARR
eukprot:g12860.t1